MKIKVKCQECNKKIRKEDSKEYKDNFTGEEYIFCSIKCLTRFFNY
jgi:YHS domain-containing protein